MSQHDTAEWGYVEPIDPAHWGDLDPAYAICRLGQAQSPIDLASDSPAGDAAPVAYRYEPAPFSICNNGHTIQVQVGLNDPETPNGITLNGVEYTLLQYHFHATSEHTVDGVYAAMEVHLVHADADGNLAVVGALMEPGEQNADLARWWDRMPAHVGGSDADAELLVDPADLLPADRRSWRYAGSLTTPPCSEGVSWVVCQEPLYLSQAQIDAFRAVMDGNIRPVCPLNGRMVTTSQG